MDSETILKTLHNRLQLQRYANNTIKSYCGYAQLFLDCMNKYHTINEIPLSEIEAFINKKVLQLWIALKRINKSSTNQCEIRQ